MLDKKVLTREACCYQSLSVLADMIRPDGSGKMGVGTLTLLLSNGFSFRHTHY